MLLVAEKWLNHSPPSFTCELQLCQEV